jgi:hypothetical protein
VRTEQPDRIVGQNEGDANRVAGKGGLENVLNVQQASITVANHLSYD